jgi:hypothetical protein
MLKHHALLRRRRRLLELTQVMRKLAGERPIA